MLSDRQVSKRMLQTSEERKIGIFTHYTPLHSSKGGKKYSKVFGQMKNTDMAYDQLFRLPLWIGMTDEQIQRVTNVIYDAVK